MYYIVESNKSFEQAAADLDAAVKRHQFGVLHIHDLGNTLRGKGIEFAEECKVFEVCSPIQAAAVLATDMRLNMALPCRISVYTEAGKTHIGLIKPVPMLGMLSSDPALAAIAREVEDATVGMVDEAK
ncbi:MAG: DUF302 domain-containing protein [Dokdonella sp.]